MPRKTAKTKAVPKPQFPKTLFVAMVADAMELVFADLSEMALEAKNGQTIGVYEFKSMGAIHTSTILEVK